MMSLPVKTLLPSVNFVKGFLADRDIVPAYKYFYFGMDSLRAYTGTAGACAYDVWPAKAVPTPFALPAAHLIKTIASFAEQGVETVDISDVKEGKVLLKGGRFRSTIPVLTADLSPFVFQEPPVEKRRVDTATGFWQDIERVLFSVSQDETRPALRAVYWSPGGGLVSSDAYRITALAAGPSSIKCPVAGGFLVPDYILARLGAKRSSIAALALSGGAEGANVLWLFPESAVVFGPTIEAAFPIAAISAAIVDTRTRIKAKEGTWATLEEEAPLDLLLNRLLVFAENPDTFRVSVESKSITIRVGGGDGSSAAEETIPAKIEGPPLEFNVRGAFFKDACQRVGRRFWTAPDLGRVNFWSDDKRLEHLILLMAA